MRTYVLGFFACCAVLAASLCDAAPTKDASIWGVTIGRAIDSYPACNSPEGEGKICVYTLTIGGKQRFTIELRPGHPKYFASNVWILSTKEGRIASFSVETKGIEYQQEIFEELTRKFGKPASVERSVVQNRFGATFPKIYAAWELKGGTLFFDGLDKNLDEGSIGIEGNLPGPDDFVPGSTNSLNSQSQRGSHDAQSKPLEGQTKALAPPSAKQEGSGSPPGIVPAVSSSLKFDIRRVDELVPGVSRSQQAIAILGAPTSESAMANGGRLLQWLDVSGAAGAHVAILFDRSDVMVNVTHRFHTGDLQQASAPAIPGAASTNPPVALNKPSKYTYAAEQFAKANGCLSPVATMVAQTPGTETFAITCPGGEQRAVRCDFGNCQAEQVSTQNAVAVGTPGQPTSQATLLAPQSAQQAGTNPLKTSVDQIIAEAKKACAREEYKPLSLHTACDINEITLAQLADKSNLAEADKPLFSKAQAEFHAFATRVTAALRSYGGPKGSELALARERTDSLSEKNALALYEGTITWGDYNKRRKEISEAWRDDSNRIVGTR